MLSILGSNALNQSPIITKIWAAIKRNNPSIQIRANLRRKFCYSTKILRLFWWTTDEHENRNEIVHATSKIEDTKN